jgi:acyl-CoA synthetase (AMP-forming)/AMP-acid ligase II
MSFVPWGQDLRSLADRFGSRRAVVTLQGEATYSDIFGRAAAIAAHLRNIGVAAGEPVAIFLRNRTEAVWASYGVTLSGAAETPINAGLGASEIEHCVELVKVRYVITDARSVPLFAKLGCRVLAVEDLASEPLRPIDPRDGVDGDAWGKIIFTSGTTGFPKGIVHSHRRRWLANVLLRAHLPHTPDESSRILLMTPFSHGASLLTYAFLDHGASIHLMNGVQVDEVRALLERRAVNAIFAPPTVLAKLVAAFQGRRFEGIRTIFCGTSTLMPQIYDAAKNIFGPVVRVTYGMSEMFNPITILPAAATDRFYSQPQTGGTSLGWPASGVEVKIVAESNGGTTGEIHIRGAHQMVGHIDQTGFHALQDGDWHVTGDIGFFSESGELHFVSRAHDVIKSGGYKVFPQEIELALGKAVAPGHIAVVGLPSNYWGEVIVAVAEGTPDGWEKRAGSAAELLTKHKRPRAYVALPALPRGGQDKVQRGKIVKQLQEHYRLEDGPQPKLLAR